MPGTAASVAVSKRPCLDGAAPVANGSGGASWADVAKVRAVETPRATEDHSAHLAASYPEEFPAIAARSQSASAKDVETAATVAVAKNNALLPCASTQTNEVIAKVVVVPKANVTGSVSVVQQNGILPKPMLAAKTNNAGVAAKQNGVAPKLAVRSQTNSAESVVAAVHENSVAPKPAVKSETNTTGSTGVAAKQTNIVAPSSPALVKGAAQKEEVLQKNGSGPSSASAPQLNGACATGKVASRRPQGREAPAVVIPVPEAAASIQDIQFGYIEQCEPEVPASADGGASVAPTTEDSGVDRFCQRFRPSPVDVSQFNWREISVFLAKTHAEAASMPGTCFEDARTLSFEARR